MLDYGFRELTLAEVLAIYEPANPASGRIMDKIGMRFDRDTRSPWFDRSLRIYRLSRAEWKAIQADRGVV